MYILQPNNIFQPERDRLISKATCSCKIKLTGFWETSVHNSTNSMQFPQTGNARPQLTERVQSTNIISSVKCVRIRAHNPQVAMQQSAAAGCTHCDLAAGWCRQARCSERVRTPARGACRRERRVWRVAGRNNARPSALG